MKLVVLNVLIPPHEMIVLQVLHVDVGLSFAF